MALFKCSECGKEISDKAAFCPHCGCPVAQTAATPNNSPKTNTPTIIEHKPKVPKKRNKALPFVVVGGVIVIAIIAILISGLFGGGKGSVATDGISNVTDGRQFLEQNLGLSKQKKLPCRVVTGHNESLFFWEQLIADAAFTKRHFILPKTFTAKTISSPLSCTLTS